MIGRFSALIALFLTASTCAGLAAPTPKPMTATYAIEQYEKGSGTVQIYIVGVLDGIEAVNSDLESDNSKKVYCPPPRMAMTPGQELDILKRFVEKHPDLGTYPAFLIIEASMKDAFPCPK